MSTAAVGARTLALWRIWLADDPSQEIAFREVDGFLVQQTDDGVLVTSENEVVLYPWNAVKALARTEVTP